MDITLPFGSLAEFRCQHQRADAIISWRVNETFRAGQFPDIINDRIAGNGRDVFTLTVPANMERNMTEIVCLAVFVDGTPPAFTPSAILIVLPAGWFTVFIVICPILIITCTAEDIISTTPPTIATTGKKEVMRSITIIVFEKDANDDTVHCYLEALYLCCDLS